jgi:hypothetical protein
LPLASAIELLVLWGEPLNVATIMIASISMGIAVDSSIHLCSAYLEARRGGSDPSEASAVATRHTAPAIATAGLVIAFGFFSLAFADFWMIACRANIGGNIPRWSWGGGVYLPTNGWYVYYIQAYHERFYYRVRQARADADFQHVMAVLQTAINSDDTPTFVQRGYTNWERLPGHTPQSFLEQMRSAWLSHLRSRKEGLVEYFLNNEAMFHELWERSARYWVNFVVEWLYLSGCAIVCIRGCRTSGKTGRILTAALFPILIFLPYLCGYAQYTMQMWMPRGGIVYPWIILAIGHLPMIWRIHSPLDALISHHLPEICEPLSQTVGSRMALPGGEHGSTAVFVMGIICGGGVWASYHLYESRFMSQKIQYIRTLLKVKRGA